MVNLDRIVQHPVYLANESIPSTQLSKEIYLTKTKVKTVGEEGYTFLYCHQPAIRQQRIGLTKILAHGTVGIKVVSGNKKIDIIGCFLLP